MSFFNDLGHAMARRRRAGQDDLDDRRFHFVLTMQWRKRSGDLVTTSMSGVYAVVPGQTREQVFTDLLQRERERLGCEDLAPLFFCLERDRLG